MAKTNQKLTKKQIDEKVLRVLELDEIVKKNQKELTDLKVLLESQYELSPEQKETISGTSTYVEKIPVDKGKNVFNPILLKPFLAALGGKVYRSVVKKVEVVDATALNKLVKEGKLPEEVLETCRIHSWTFKSAFKRKEEVVQKETKQEAKKEVKSRKRQAQAS